MIVIVAAVPKLKEEKRLVELLLKAFEGKKLELFEEGRQGFCIRSIVLNVNREKTNVILGRESRVLYGADFIEDRIKDLRCRISSKSFYQVNPLQTVVLYQTALDYAALTGTQTVWDLYCGTGTISLFLARKARHVIGVEVIPEAVENARQNASLNRIGNCEFLVGKAEELAPTLPPADVIVVDPPRKGCSKETLDAIVTIGPERLVYVSCDPSTLARDVAYLKEKGFRLEKVQPVDMFPHTNHIETIVLLQKLNS
jgi:23S rRNA (uracil1939-C5)-methyltransferase